MERDQREEVEIEKERESEVRVSPFRVDSKVERECRVKKWRVKLRKWGRKQKEDRDKSEVKKWREQGDEKVGRESNLIIRERKWKEKMGEKVE